MSEFQTFDRPAVSGFDQSALFSYLAGKAYQNTLAFAMWQLPGQNQKHFIADLSGELKRTKADLDDLPEGFVFSPFANPDLDKTVLIQADVHYHSEEKQISVHPLAANDKSKLIRDFQFTPDQMANISQAPWHQGPDLEMKDTSSQEYLRNVERAIDLIARGDIQKVVLSKVKSIPLSATFDPVANFFLICQTYHNAFVSLVSVPSLGTWIGASPETLIGIDDSTFRTTSLAGTQILDPNIALPDVAWTQKEIEEQALVSRYIINCFKKIRLREFEEVGPRTVRAANLIHLRTDYLVDLTAVNFPQLGTVMLELLHPTSAVCGMPKDEALDFIQKTEAFDRAYYSGFLGPTNVMGSTDIFVNLRCMQLLEDKAVLYSGAGITAESKPEKEWLETELKCDTLLNLVKP